MSNGNIREFRLAPPGSRRGVTCGADGAFVCGVSLLRRIKGSNDSTSWETRDGAILSSELSDAFGLPIDVASKSSGLSALAKHLNNGDVAHAQLVALLMKIPESEPPPDAPGHSRARFIDLIKALYSSGMLKTDWDPNLHPRWPAGSIDSRGGQFAPKNDDVGSDTRTSSNSESQEDFRPLDHNDLEVPEQPADRFGGARAVEAVASSEYGSTEELFDPVVYRGVFHDQEVARLANYLRSRGLKVETELPLYMADGSGSARIDILAKGEITFGIEVKTGDEPSMTPGQLYVYPHLMMGGSVLTPNPRIGTLGLLPMVPLPPIPIVLYYQQDDTSETISEPLSAAKMLREFYRRFGAGRVRKSIDIWLE